MDVDVVVTWMVEEVVSAMRTDMGTGTATTTAAAIIREVRMGMATTRISVITTRRPSTRVHTGHLRTSSRTRISLIRTTSRSTSLISNLDTVDVEVVRMGMGVVAVGVLPGTTIIHMTTRMGTRTMGLAVGTVGEEAVMEAMEATEEVEAAAGEVMEGEATEADKDMGEGPGVEETMVDMEDSSSSNSIKTTTTTGVLTTTTRVEVVAVAATGGRSPSL